MTGFWNTVVGKWVGGVLSVATVALCVAVVTHMVDFWEVQAAVKELADNQTTKQQISKNNQEKMIKLMEGLSKQMSDVITKQEYFEKLLVTPDVGGRATVGTFGRDSAYVEINEAGKANMYLAVNQISLSYRDVDGISHKVELSVRGSFINRDDNGHLLMLSAKAGRDLGMNGIKRQIIVGASRCDPCD